jgi:hypothetical protein
MGRHVFKFSGIFFLIIIFSGLSWDILRSGGMGLANQTAGKPIRFGAFVASLKILGQTGTRQVGFWL